MNIHADSKPASGSGPRAQGAGPWGTPAPWSHSQYNEPESGSVRFSIQMYIYILLVGLAPVVSVRLNVHLFISVYMNINADSKPASGSGPRAPGARPWGTPTLWFHAQNNEPESGSVRLYIQMYRCILLVGLAPFESACRRWSGW